MTNSEGETGDWFRNDEDSERLLAAERVVLSATEMLAEAMEKRKVDANELARRLHVPPQVITHTLSGEEDLTLLNLVIMLHATFETRMKPSRPEGSDV